MRQEILRILKNDPILRKIVEHNKLEKIRANPDIFQSLINSIISQQISLKAAESIYYKLIKIFRPNFEIPTVGHWNQQLGDEGKLHPEEILEKGEDILNAGLTRRKTEYILNVAEFELEHGLSREKLDGMTDQEVVDYLTQIKGIGIWTAHMILMFSLEREDIFPLEDLSIRNGIIKLYDLSDPNPPKNKSNHSKILRNEIVGIADNWKPYRSYACFYIWQHFETMGDRTI